ncbi:unnamed protein product [Toxocara canis]|nr:unnamed protein product [Toxocara canis]
MRIRNAKLHADSIDFKALPDDDLSAYGSAKSKNMIKSPASLRSSPSESDQHTAPLVGAAMSPTLNNLIRTRSANADLVLVNLPRANMEASASRLLLSLDMIGDHLPRMVAFRPPSRNHS